MALYVNRTKSKHPNIEKKPSINDKTHWIWYASLAILAVFPTLSIPGFNAQFARAVFASFVQIGWIGAQGIMFVVLFRVAKEEDIGHSIKKFLSLHLFQILSKLSLSIYLVHPVMIWFDIYSMHSPFQMTINNIVSTHSTGHIINLFDSTNSNADHVGACRVNAVHSTGNGHLFTLRCDSPKYDQIVLESPSFWPGEWCAQRWFAIFDNQLGIHTYQTSQ